MPRQMRCPRCSTINTVPEGAKPVCRSCGFGATPGTPLPPPPGGEGGPGMEVPVFGGQATTPPTAERRAMGGSTIAALATFAVALGILVLVQFPFMPWSTGDMQASAFGETFQTQLNYTMWTGEFAGGEGTEPESNSYWHNSTQQDGEDMGGLWFLRLGGPLVVLGIAVAAVAAVVTLLGKRGLSNTLGWAGFSVAASGVVAFVIGIYQNQEWTRDMVTSNAPPGASFTLDFAWGLSFYLAIGAVILIAVATYLASLRPRAPPASRAPPRRTA